MALALFLQLSSSQHTSSSNVHADAVSNVYAVLMIALKCCLFHKNYRKNWSANLKCGGYTPWILCDINFHSHTRRHLHTWGRCKCRHAPLNVTKSRSTEGKTTPFTTPVTGNLANIWLKYLANILIHSFVETVGTLAHWSNDGPIH